ncbi:MAG: putative tip attachment protein J [Prokaryotic dsDNA virus sp.]|nr:MAG: putative tip attachment protein J [Prokaryotic dsDNA virus sp.]|tara:strand:+ start:12554 stop:15361 length:2808 start_codon:yes stop_codon:yes gene_type:complete
MAVAPPPGTGNFFAKIGASIVKFFSGKAAAMTYVQTAFFVAQGVLSHKARMKAQRSGADILLQKYGTGGGMPVIYGRRRVAGNVVFMETVNNKELFVVYAIAGHEIDSFEAQTIQINGRSINDTSVFRQGYAIADGTFRYERKDASNYTLTTNSNYFGTGSGTGSVANILAGADPFAQPRMVFNLHQGTLSQAVDPMLTGVFNGTNASTVWSSNHKLTGIAYIACNFEYDTKGMFQGIPNITVVVNGKKVYDPRLDSAYGSGSQDFANTSTHTWSDNAALCLLDYLKDKDYGKGLAETDLDMPSFVEAANDCGDSETPVDISALVTSATSNNDRILLADGTSNRTAFNKMQVGNKFTVTTSGGTTVVNNKELVDKSTDIIDISGSNPISLLFLHFERGSIVSEITTNTTCTFSQGQRRFHCNGVVDTSESVLENTKDLVANMRGIFTYTNGKYTIKVEGSESVVQTLTDDMILDSGISLTFENKEKKYNKVEVEFFNAQKRYETDTVINTGESSDTFLSDDGEVLETRIQFPYVTNYKIANHHAKAILQRSRKQKMITFKSTPRVLLSKVGEVIAITNSALNMSAEQYRIINMTIQPDMNVEVTAIEYQGDIYGFTDPPDEDLGIPNDPVEMNRVLAPSSLTFTAKNTSTGVPARLTWTDSSKYPSYKFNVVVKDSSGNIRFTGETRNTFFNLDGIEVQNSFSGEVSAVNSLGVESAASTVSFNNTTSPIQRPDLPDDIITADHISANSIDATMIDVDNLAAIESNLGTITAGVINADNITVQNLDAANISNNGLDNTIILADAFVGDYGINAPGSTTTLTTSFQTLATFTLPASKESGKIGIFAAGDVGNTATSNSQVRFDIFHGGTSVANYTSSQGVEAALAPFILAAEVSADTTATKTFELKGKTINPDVSESLAVFNVAIQAIKINSSGVT